MTPIMERPSGARNLFRFKVLSQPTLANLRERASKKEEEDDKKIGDKKMRHGFSFFCHFPFRFLGCGKVSPGGAETRRERKTAILKSRPCVPFTPSPCHLVISPGDHGFDLVERTVRAQALSDHPAQGLQIVNRVDFRKQREGRRAEFHFQNQLETRAQFFAASFQAFFQTFLTALGKAPGLFSSES